MLRCKNFQIKFAQKLMMNTCANFFHFAKLIVDNVCTYVVPISETDSFMRNKIWLPGDDVGVHPTAKYSYQTILNNWNVTESYFLFSRLKFLQNRETRQRTKWIKRKKILEVESQKWFEDWKKHWLGENMNIGSNENSGFTLLNLGTALHCQMWSKSERTENTK